MFFATDYCGRQISGPEGPWQQWLTKFRLPETGRLGRPVRGNTLGTLEPLHACGWRDAPCFPVSLIESDIARMASFCHFLQYTYDKIVEDARELAFISHQWVRCKEIKYRFLWTDSQPPRCKKLCQPPCFNSFMSLPNCETCSLTLIYHPGVLWQCLQTLFSR